MAFKNRPKKIFDGLKLFVQFYANYGKLKQVEDKTGVSVERLGKWLGGQIELTKEERKALTPKTKEPADE